MFERGILHLPFQILTSIALSGFLRPYENSGYCYFTGKVADFNER
jgi:hypothetical protein